MLRLSLQLGMTKPTNTVTVADPVPPSGAVNPDDSAMKNPDGSDAVNPA